MAMAARLRWLKLGSALTVLFGILIAAAATPTLQAPIEWSLDLVYFPLDDAPQIQGSALRLISAISGGVMVGWGVMLWMVATQVFSQHPALGRRLILGSVGAWFVIDSSMSVAAGAPLNAFLNTGFLLVFFLPVWKQIDATQEADSALARQRN